MKPQTGPKSRHPLSSNFQAQSYGEAKNGFKGRSSLTQFIACPWALGPGKTKGHPHFSKTADLEKEVTKRPEQVREEINLMCGSGSLRPVG